MYIPSKFINERRMRGAGGTFSLKEYGDVRNLGSAHFLFLII